MTEVDFTFYGSPAAGKTMSGLNATWEAIARKYENPPDAWFWSWLQETLSPEDYEASRAQPIDFIYRLHAAAWRTQLHKLLAEELGRHARGEYEAGDTQFTVIESQPVFDPNWAQPLTSDLDHTL